MAYQMTPSERRARALALKQQRENRNLYQQYLTQKEEYDRRVEQERLNALYEENKVKNQNFFVRAGHTIGDIAANVITGAVKGLEGIYDLGAGIVGAVGGIFDKGFQDDVKKHISYDWTMETFGNDWQEALKYSYTKNGGIVESVASGIGQMLPSVAVTIATDGAGAPAAVSQMASLATLGASAAGNATEEAFNDGAGYYAGLGYGLASGAVEIATEKMFGGATKGLFGKGMLDEVGKSIADTGIKRIAKNALEEGVEEIVSELANPLLRSMYKGGEALQDYGTGEYWAGVAKAGIVGSLTSLAYTGTVGYGLSKAGVGYVGKEADINESLAEIETQKKKAENLFANEKLTEQNESRISSNIVGNYQNIERTLKKASESKRASLIKKFSLEKAFNPDGSIKGDFATQIGLTSNEAQVAQEGQQGSNEGLASQFKKEYYSPSLRGSEAMIQADLAAMTERLRTDEKNFATQQGREAQEIAEVKPFTGEMSDTAKKNYTSLKKGLNALNNTSGGKIRLVVVDSHDSINGSIVNDSTFYISESQLESGAWAETLVHEYTHFAEGSKEYGKLLGFLQSDDILVEGAEGKSIPLWQKAQEAVIRNYGFDQKRLESIVERGGKNESLSPEDMVYYNAYLSELGAHESEYLLGNEAFIDKIISKDKSLAAKIIEKIRNLKSMFEKTKDTRTKQEQKLIHKAEKLWLNAVEKAGLKYVGGKIYRRREVDAKAQNEYNGEASEARLSRKDSLINHTFPTYKESAGSEANTLATRWAHRADIEVGDRTAISYYDKWYLVEKFENSDLGYQIVAQISEKQYQEFIEERNNGIGKGQSIQKSVSVITSIDRRRDSSVGRVVSDDSVSPRNGRGDNQVQRVGEEQSQRGKTQSNRSGNSEGGGQGKRGIKFSLKIGDETLQGIGEENKNLVALHNLSETKLLKVLELGGFPMPSIAVTRAELSHDEFGDITIIFGRDTIDPQKRSENKVYSKDGWTPTVPAIEYKPSEKVQKRIHDKYYALAREVGYDTVRPLYKYVSDIERVLANSNGEIGMLSDIYTDTDIMNIFLIDTGRGKINPIQKEIRTELPQGEIQYNEKLVKALGKDFLMEFSELKGEERRDFVKNNKDKIVEALATIMQGKESFEETKQMISENFSVFQLGITLNKAISYLNNGSVTIKTEYDSTATQDAIRKATPQKEYREWVDSIFSGIQEKIGIRNEVDPFTRSGNRRSFEATHYDYTLENIVEVMRSGDQVGGNWLHGLTLGQLSAKLAREFKSIEEIRESSHSLKKIDESTHEEFSETSRKMLSEITDEMVDESKFSDTVDYWSALDSAAVVVGEIADRKLFTLEKIDSFMKKEYRIYRYNDGIGRKILGLFAYVKQMTDTDYFEAKPRRAIGFEEIKKVLIPEGASEKLINALQEKGIDYTTYSEGQSRSDIIQKMDEVKFSRKDSQGRTLTEAQERFFRDSQVRDDKGNLLEVYHGTKDGQFSIFEYSPNRQTGDDFGEAYYFTTNLQNAKGYAKDNYKDPRVQAYEKAKNELIHEYLQEQDLGKKKALEKQILNFKYNGMSLTDILYDIDYDTGGEVKSVYLNLTNPLVVDAHEQYYYQVYPQYFEEAREGGYDGIIVKNVYDSSKGNIGISDVYIAFHPNQIKLITNENPTSRVDIRFSKKRTSVEETHRTYYKLSDGQIKKLLANNTHYKVYSKVDAERIINNVLSQYMSFGEKYGEISGKSKAEVIDLLWKGLNSAEPGKQMGVALHIADYIIQNSVLESIYSDDDVQIQSAIDIVDALRPYLHSINLDSLKGEIKYRYDKDNSAYLLWGKRKGDKGIGVDTIPQILEEQGIYIDATSEADIFFEIDAQYRNAVKSLKKKAKDMLFESLSKEQVKELRQEIAREVLRGFDYTGKSSKLAEVLDKYKKQISTLYEKLRESNRHNKATNRLLDKVQKIKNWKTGAFVNSSKFRSKLFKGSIERLAMIKNRGNLNQSGTRRILAGLAEWYAKDNPILGYVDGENVGVYNQEIADILQAISQNQKALTDEQVDLISVLQEKSGITDYKGLLEWYTKANLGKGYNAEVKSLLRELASETTFTTEEIIALEKVVGYFGNLIENYNKVIRNGKYVDAKPIAKGYIETIKRNKGVKVGWFSKFFDKVFNNGKASYLQTFADPMTVARYMDKYENGFYSEMLAELRAGGIKASVLEMNIRQPLEEFLSKHKKYGRGVSQRTIKYKGVELPALDAFLLYMTMNREQALGGLAEAGFTFNNGKETIRVDGFAKGEELTLPELRERAKAEQDELYKQFTEEDREYISIAEKIFNEDCKEAKRETDILRQGYSNVFEGYYVPIRRANSAVTVDSGSFFDEMNRVSNASFNKDTVQGAKGELFIEGLDEVLDRHIHGVSQYAGLATVIDQYDILYNLNMSEDANKPITVRTEGENTWAKGNDYFKKLISDLQGISPTRGGGSKLFGFFRGHYATYQLGLNPKVWFTQLSSFFASGSILDYSSILKGLSINAKDVDEYCQLAAVRNNDNSAAMAQGVMEKVDKVGSALMKPIGMVDRFVIKKLFGACQVQVEKDSGFKVGTEENKKKAGELLEKVIVETQQNSMATERSAAMRSGSELMKTLTMFTADSMKVFGRVVDSLGEVSVLKAKIKETTDSKAKAALEEKLKAAKKKSVKSVAALATTAIFMALIAQAFRWLYNKDDDDENIPANMAVDAIGNLMGGLPLIKDLYAKLTEGYDLNNYSYSALNDLFDAFSGTISTVTSLAKGEDIKPLRTVKELSFAVGQILGLPTRNVYNIIYGLMKRISPSTAYEWDNNLYNKNYSTDLQKAISNDDDEMLATIVGLMLDEKVGGIDNSFAREEMDRLVKGGYQVIPKSIGSTISYEGEEVEITSKQRERFKKVYGEANKALASLVNNKSYASASDEVKAKAVRFIYDIYYNLAIEDLLGVELETKNILFAKAIDISSLAIIVATARSIEADTDKKGNIVSGSRKKKVQTYINSLGLKVAQKYMIMGYLGYSNKNGQQQVKSYIQRLSLTKSEKEKLYEYSGYAA